MNNFKKVYESNKQWFFNQPENKGMQLHHVEGRRGVYLCCRQLMIGLTNAEHGDWRVLKMLREENKPLKLKIDRNYDRIRGICIMKINEKCNGCPLTV